MGAVAAAAQCSGDAGVGVVGRTSFYVKGLKLKSGFYQEKHFFLYSKGAHHLCEFFL